MNKALMISIQPQHAYNILIGKKTLELRTWIPKGYVGWVYVYITKGKRLSVVHDDENGETYYYLNSNWGRSLNQDIPFRFWFDEYETIPYEVTLPQGYESYDGEWIDNSLYGYWVNNTFLELSCLTDKEISLYGNGKDLYAWHIKKLEIFDEPKQLSEFVVGLNYLGDIIPPTYKKLKKAPQRSVWVYVEDKE